MKKLLLLTLITSAYTAQAHYYQSEESYYPPEYYQSDWRYRRPYRYDNRGPVTNTVYAAEDITEDAARIPGNVISDIFR